MVPHADLHRARLTLDLNGKVAQTAVSQEGEALLQRAVLGACRERHCLGGLVPRGGDEFDLGVRPNADFKPAVPSAVAEDEPT